MTKEELIQALLQNTLVLLKEQQSHMLKEVLYSYFQTDSYRETYEEHLTVCEFHTHWNQDTDKLTKVISQVEKALVVKIRKQVDRLVSNDCQIVGLGQNTIGHFIVMQNGVQKDAQVQCSWGLLETLYTGRTVTKVTGWLYR